MEILFNLQKVMKLFVCDIFAASNFIFFRIRRFKIYFTDSSVFDNGSRAEPMHSFFRIYSGNDYVWTVQDGQDIIGWLGKFGWLWLGLYEMVKIKIAMDDRYVICKDSSELI